MVVDSDADTDSVYEVEYERQSHLITLDEIYKLAKKISEDFDEFSKVCQYLLLYHFSLSFNFRTKIISEFFKTSMQSSLVGDCFGHFENLP